MNNHEFIERLRENELESQEDLSALLTGMMPIGMISSYCEKGFPLHAVSQEFYHMMGYDTEQEFEAAIQGKTSNVIYYEDKARVMGEFGNDFYAGKEYTITYRMPKKDGSLFWVLDKGRIAKTKEQRLVIFSFCMDITEIMEKQMSLQQSVAELQKQNKELQYLNNTVPVGYHRCADTPDYDFLFVSNKFLDMLGYTRQDIKDLFDDKFRNMIHPDDWQRVFGGEENRTAARHSNLRFEYRMKSKDGYIWVEDYTDYITGLKKPFFQGAIMDITDSVRLREKLDASIKAFRIAAKETHNLVFTYNRKEQAIYCDEKVTRGFGLNEHQTGVPYDIAKQGKIVSQDTVETYIHAYEAMIRGEKESGGLVKLTDVNGKEGIFELKLQLICDDEGNPSDLAVGVYTDITEQYLHTQELEQSELKLKEEYLAAKEKQDIERHEQLDMIYALSRDYYSLWKVDLKNDRIILKRNEIRNACVVTDDERKVPDSYMESLEIYARKWVHPEDRTKLCTEASLDRIRERLKTEETFSVRLRRRTPREDHYGYVEWRIVRMTDSEGAYTALIAVRDVDGEVLQEEQRQALLKDALAQAQHANRAKTTFLSNMSHDIRTPMNAIIGFTGIAASHIDNKERVLDCLTKIASSSNHLLSLINDILDMSRIESGKITIKEKECNLSERIHNLVNMIRPQMWAKQLEFFVDTIDVRDEDLIFDPLRLDQVLINILGNAVKFTPPGGVVSFTIQQSESEKPGCGHYKFIIKDTGIGMSQEFLKRIFEPFERENSSTISATEGTGLGMAITKNTVDMMGGTIRIESQPAKGSTFFVEFDFKRQDVSERQERIKELEGLRALVVDDDFHICDSVTKMLTQIGMRSEWTTSGREAVFRAQKAHSEGDFFHSYIIDWLMPHMDGIETVRRIRKVIGDETPIIILTAYDWTDIEEEAREAGVTAFCSKPLFMSDLRNVLLETQQLSGKKNRTTEQKERDFEHTRVLVVEDNELNREIAAEILLSRGFEVTCASDGSIAVDIMRNAKENQFDLILMDIQMPVMDGYEATRMIRNLPRKDVVKLPIIAMTANAFEEDRERALENGMNAHIAKPLNVDTLLATLDRILSAQ